MVWDDKLEVADDSASLEAIAGPLSGSIASLPPRVTSPGHQRVRSSASEFPPPRMRRMSTDNSGFQRPVPFSAKFQRVHPGTTGVTVLEHMERLDKVEASLDRLAGGEDEAEMDEEQDVGDLARPTVPVMALLSPPEAISGPSSAPSAPFAGPSPSLAPVQEVSSSSSTHSQTDAASPPPEVDEEDEEDVAALSKSLSHIDHVAHGRWTRQLGIEPRTAAPGLEWMQSQDSEVASKKTVIVEVSHASLTSRSGD